MFPKPPNRENLRQALEAQRSTVSRTRLISVAAVAAIGFMFWVSDTITPQGQRTVFTAECEGPWQGHRCRGKLVPGRRYVFQALKSKGQVLFWTVESSGPRGSFADCLILDGRDWSCKPNEEAKLTIAHEIEKGLPVPDASRSIAFHQIPKWKWLLLRFNLPAGDEAMT